MADRCPFHRALTDHFEGCPAFQAAEFITVDLQHRATRPVWTCRYLAIGSAQTGEYYPACGLGDSEQRESFVARVKAERRELFGALQLELTEVLSPHAMELVEAKSRRLQRGERLSPEDDGEVAELVRLAIRDVDMLLELRRVELRQLGVPADACRALIESVLLKLGRGSDHSFPAIGRDQLRGMPADVAELLAAFRG